MGYLFENKTDQCTENSRTAHTECGKQNKLHNLSPRYFCKYVFINNLNCTSGQFDRTLADEILEHTRHNLPRIS